jgi:hypothetical protein
MCWFHANATQFWIRAVINLGFYPQEALKPIHQRCWEGTHTLSATTTHQTEALYNVRTRFPYHYLEASIEDHVWSGGLTQDATSAKVSPVMVRSWIWNSPSSSPVLGSALSFWEQSKAHLSVGCILSSQALAFKPGSHENVLVSVHFLYKTRRDTLTAFMNAVHGLQVHENPDFAPRWCEVWVEGRGSFVILYPADSPLISPSLLPYATGPSFTNHQISQTTLLSSSWNMCVTDLHIYHIDSAIEWRS